MKLKNKKVWLIVTIVILAVVFSTLFTTYSRQVREREELADRLSRAQTLLPGLVEQRRDHEDRLVRAQAALDASQAQFPALVASIEYNEDLFKLAVECGVVITEITASLPADETIGNISYSVAAYDIVVVGKIDDILRFVDALRTGEDFQLPWSVDLKSVNIGWGEEETRATIHLDIYGYRR
jgi:hypothetical protein